jgi:hypothetical protein
MDSGKLGKVTLARTWWHGNSYHLRKAPDRLKDLLPTWIGRILGTAQMA